MNNIKLVLFQCYVAFVQIRIVPDRVDVRFGINGTCAALCGLG